MSGRHFRPPSSSAITATDRDRGEGGGGGGGVERRGSEEGICWAGKLVLNGELLHGALIL